MKKRPRWTKKHIEAKLLFAEEHETSLFTNSVFSDEKGFNLDGPDGWRCYWHGGLGTYSKRLLSDGGLMFWVAFA